MRSSFRCWPFHGRRINVENVQDVEGSIGGSEIHHSGMERADKRADCCSTTSITTISEIVDNISDYSDIVPPIFMAIQMGDNDMLRMILEENPDEANMGRYHGSPPLHAACHGTNMFALKELLKCGAQVDSMDDFGNTALHLAVDTQWYQGVSELLFQRASPDIQCEPPDTDSELRLETPLHAAVLRGDLTSFTLMLQQRPNLTIRDGHSRSLFHLAAQVRSVDIIKQLLAKESCKYMLTTYDCEGNSVIHAALSKHYPKQRESMLEETIRVLLEAGAEIGHLNCRGECPLFLAAHLRVPKMVELLLSKGADPMPITKSGRSVLHAACGSGCDISLSHFLNTGKLKNFITVADSEGAEPFHFALRSGSIDCCELLLKNGDHLTQRDKNGKTRCALILKHLPSAEQLFKTLFDDNVHKSDKPHFDPDFSITFNYGILLFSEENSIQSSIICKVSATNLVFLLKHPLLESFLYIKWQKIRFLFYGRALMYLIFLLTNTSFIVLTFGQNPPRNWYLHREYLNAFIIIHIVLFILIIIADFIVLLGNLRKYLRQWETLSKLIALSTSVMVVLLYMIPFESNDVPDNQAYSMLFSNITENSSNLTSMTLNPEMLVTVKKTQILYIKHFAAIAAVFGWLEFMLLLGRVPSLGVYVLTFTYIAESLTKFLLAFSSLLIGFATSFMVLFHPHPMFSNFPSSMVKSLMMMIGEIDYVDLSNNEMPIISGLFLVLFLFLVCVLMTNLLIGLAVNDIQDLQRQGKIIRLSKQVSYLKAHEKLMKICLPRRFCLFIRNWSRIHSKVVVFPNRKKKLYRHQQELPLEVIKEAILICDSKGSKKEFASVKKEEGEENISSQFKSFKDKYNEDQAFLQRQITKLLDQKSATERILKEELANMQQVMERQMLQLESKINS